MSNSEERKREATNSSVDSLAEIASRMLERMTDSKSLKDVPVVNTAVSVIRLATTVRDKLLERRIEAFIDAVREGLQPWEVKDTVSRLQATRHYAETVGEYLVERMERIDGKRKALMAAEVLVSFGKLKIDEDDFYRLLHAIEVVHLPDLPALRNIQEEGPISYNASTGNTRKFNPTQESLQSLQASSLVHSVASAALGSTLRPGWWATSTGGKFLDLRLDLIPYKED